MNTSTVAFLLLLLTGICACGNSSNQATQEKDPFSDPSLSTEIPSPGEESSFEERLAAYESKDRVFWQKPDLVIDLLGDLSEKTVADIGAGSGYFARRMAYKAKHVIAIDINEQFIEFMDSIKLVELPTEIQDRFETRLATPRDSKLSNGEADVVIFVNTYIYIPNRVEYLSRLKEGVKPGGKIVIVDFKKKRMPIENPPDELRLPLHQVENELEEAGYRWLASDDTSLNYQYIVIGER
ncbi:MAG: class I SAM-dependent methyltransferase [Saprospirales bacterium]|nr:class I SAM-dependent methyltransferase [Saprospirales bacterium]